MAGSDFPKFEFPTDMHAFAEKSMEQARKAFETFVSAATQGVSGVEGQAATLRTGARQVVELTIRHAEQNMAAAFAFGQRLVMARDPQDAMQIQADYVKSHVQTLTDQAKELAAVASKATTPPAR
ncbi:MAG: phasin [Pseudolabrys sp.]|nr:phasin [Pseudolabrys sp.]MCW5686330.1 phasin [Pseudolabrys sp.]